jgi:hypothetical protein
VGVGVSPIYLLPRTGFTCNPSSQNQPKIRTYWQSQKSTLWQHVYPSQDDKSRPTNVPNRAIEPVPRNSYQIFLYDTVFLQDH